MPCVRKFEFLESFDGPSEPMSPLEFPTLSGTEEGETGTNRRPDFPEFAIAPAEAISEKPLSPEEIEHLREQARIDADQAYARGLEDGRARGLAEAKAEAEVMMAATLRDIAAAMPDVLREARAVREQVEMDLTALVCRLVRALAPSVATRLRTAQLEGFVVDCLRAALPGAVVAVRVSPSDHLEIAERLKAIAVDTGHPDGVSVAVDDRLAPGSARVDWAGGSGSWDEGKAMRALTDGLDAALKDLRPGRMMESKE